MQRHAKQYNAMPWNAIQCMEQTQSSTTPCRLSTQLDWDIMLTPSQFRDGGRVKGICLHSPWAKIGHKVCRDGGMAIIRNYYLYNTHTIPACARGHSCSPITSMQVCIFVRAMLVLTLESSMCWDWSVSTLHCNLFQHASLSHHSHPIVAKHTPHRRSSPRN